MKIDFQQEKDEINIGVRAERKKRRNQSQSQSQLIKEKRSRRDSMEEETPNPTNVDLLSRKSTFPDGMESCFDDDPRRLTSLD